MSYRWKECECGGKRPFDARCCFRCETIDDGFLLVETLIAMGLEDTRQDKISEAKMNLARRNPARPTIMRGAA